MSLRSVPQNGQTNWGTALNNHLGQLMDPTYGGFNIVQDDEDRDSKFSGLTQQNEGLTVFNREIGKFQVFTATPFGTAWQDLPAEMRPKQETGVGQIVQDNEGMLSVTGASGATLQQLGIGFGTTIYVNGNSGVVTRIEGQKFWAGLLGDVQEYVENIVNITASSNEVTGNFSGLNIGVGDHFTSIAWGLDGFITNVSPTKLTINSSGASRTLETGFRITKRLPSTSYQKAQAAISIINDKEESSFTVSNNGRVLAKLLTVRGDNINYLPVTFQSYNPANNNGSNRTVIIDNIFDDNSFGDILESNGCYVRTINSSQRKINFQRSVSTVTGLGANGEIVSSSAFYSSFAGTGTGKIDNFTAFNSAINSVVNCEVTKMWSFYDGLSVNSATQGVGNYFRNKVGIGVGGSSPNQITEQLHVSGNILATGTVTQNSDITLKKDITEISDALAKIVSLRGVNYKWKKPENHGEDEGTQLGVIAQEVEKVFPEAVRTDKDGIKSVKYGDLVAPLIEAVKELTARVKELEAKVK